LREVISRGFQDVAENNHLGVVFLTIVELSPHLVNLLSHVLEDDSGVVDVLIASDGFLICVHINSVCCADKE